MSRQGKLPFSDVCACSCDCIKTVTGAGHVCVDCRYGDHAIVDIEKDRARTSGRVEGKGFGWVN